MSKKQAVAFFDIDGTLFRSSLLIELVEELIARGIFPASAKEAYRREYQAWMNREGGYEDYIDSLIGAFRQHIKGVPYGTFSDVGKEVVKNHQHKVYRYTRDLLRRLSAEDYYLVAISQSPKTILDLFCGQYGFDKVYGRIYEIGPQDNLTGEVIDEAQIANKAAIVQRVFSKNLDLDQGRSLAVGDTDGDIPLLESVTRPICFNPNQSLLTYAEKRGWEVVIERKDVIYFIK